MKRSNPKLQRLFALSLLGLLLLTFPLLGLPRGQWFGLPAAFVYLFGVWFLLIVAAAWVVEKRGA